jgi:TatD DNase family protein
VRRILTIGNGRGPGDMGCGIPIAEAHDWIVTSVGIHPHDAAKSGEPHYTLMRELAAHRKVVAIGEAGLDYYYDNSPRDTQRQVFRRQLRLAREVDLPVIIHTRDADDDTERILQEEGPLRGVIHCFSSSDRLAAAAVALGFYISFSGIVTFPKTQGIAQVAAKLGNDQLLVETDCPYLAPVPHRGKRNEPAFVRDTAGFVAAVRGTSVEALAAVSTANFSRLFDA